jgi:PAS domain-containing protein
VSSLEESTVRTPTTVLLTEEPLSAADAVRLTDLHAGEAIHYRVLVPADVDRNLLVDVLDHLSLLELRQALEAVRGDDEPTRAQAAQALAESVEALRTALEGVGGAVADGTVVDGDPVAALQTAVKEDADVTEVIIVTRPHAVEDTFHRDWASRAREVLGLPVLHVYSGSSFLG